MFLPGSPHSTTDEVPVVPVDVCWYGVLWEADGGKKRSQNLLLSWPDREPRHVADRLALLLCIREVQGSRLG